MAVMDSWLPKIVALVRVVTLVAATTLATVASAQDKRGIEANDLYRIRTASGIALSPDGEQLAFTVTQIGAENPIAPDEIEIQFLGSDLDAPPVARYLFSAPLALGRYRIVVVPDGSSLSRSSVVWSIRVGA